MGRQGPCYHCGVASTPLWRHGPPEKPVLCNACGSRWRTKGSLEKYTPLHSRYDSDNCEDHRVMRMKNISLKKTGEKLYKRKLNSDNAMAMESREFSSGYNHGHRKNSDEDTSNRSSSGSAISNSESCARYGSADASDLTGPAQSMVWHAQIPSRKRTCVSRPKLSSVEKLTKDLYTIMHEQASRFSGSSEEDLLFESEAPLVSVEIGHGSVLIRHPSSMAREDDSEASSLSQHKGAEDSTEQLISKSGAKSGFTSTLVSGKRFRECSNNLGPVPAYARNIPRQEFIDAKLEAMSLYEVPEMAVNLLETYEDLFEIKATSNRLQGDLRCLSSGSICYFLYPEVCCSGMCKLAPQGPFGRCLGN